ncbi:hypothetical protein JHK87_001104 [Glycine soja]|nr:hypothetical protein JHK87_001104 [Glycine soja]
MHPWSSRNTQEGNLVDFCERCIFGRVGVLGRKTLQCEKDLDLRNLKRVRITRLQIHGFDLFFFVRFSTKVRYLFNLLLNDFMLLLEKALVVYIHFSRSPFVLCGTIMVSCPSVVVTFLWPELEANRPL